MSFKHISKKVSVIFPFGYIILNFKIELNIVVVLIDLEIY